MRDLRVVSLLVALAAIGCSKSRVVRPSDGAVAAPVDAAQDVADAASDAAADASYDAAADASYDAAGDASSDASTDASSDASTDASSDASADASPDAAADASVDAATPDASAPECAPGAVGCFGRVPRVCTAEGRWTPGERCPNFCYQGQCVPCIPGVTVCWTSQIQRCSADYVWEVCTGPGCACTDFPRDCTVAGAECGIISDALGGLAYCDPELGGCPPGFGCGTGSVANRCDPIVAGATKECTPDTFDCSGSNRRRCSRTGKWLPLLPNEPCGTPSVCLARRIHCGIFHDSALGDVDCGSCPPPYDCGAVEANRCGIAP